MRTRNDEIYQLTKNQALRRGKCPTIQQKNEWTQKWPYEKDTLACESTLCVAWGLIRELLLISISVKRKIIHMLYRF
jgi:hypothetical protein